GIAGDFRKIGRDWRPNIGNQAALQRDADERRDDALGCRLDVGKTLRGYAVVVALEDQLTAPAHEKAVETREFLHGSVERVGTEPSSVGSLDRTDHGRNKQEETNAAGDSHGARAIAASSVESASRFEGPSESAHIAEPLHTLPLHFGRVDVAL